MNHRRHLVAAGDLASFRSLADGLSGQEFSHLWMTRYEEDSLTVFTNERRGWLMYLKTPDDGGLYARDEQYNGPPEAEEAFQCCCGIAMEFRTWNTLPVESAKRTAAEFFRTGRIPDDVSWVEG